ncbi:winged helix-turn-helix domain-containing protein [Burkholderia vietnamiensis]|uniref:winged helix-turn-helix domain-containing protein n=1 Tax=Burkholderia vietnamiensis TaxID=60552 RepID=UPI002DD44534|nr:winged helix-turn-helix domain-containing protein [Burkholderia vietnamiensis]MEC4596111.1 winged helix-turn-helix domain-containing protein [Burkholderia vietnamiensis]
MAAGDYLLDPRERTITLRGAPIKLTPKEFDLAELFFNNVGKLLSRKLVCMSTWGRELDPESRTLDTHIYRLRQKLERCPETACGSVSPIRTAIASKRCRRSALTAARRRCVSPPSRCRRPG